MCESICNHLEKLWCPDAVSSPEGVPMDATLSTPFKTALGPEVFINVNADNTMAFSEWAMGSDAHGASATPLPNVTPSREVTPMLRRHSRTAQVSFEVCPMQTTSFHSLPVLPLDCPVYFLLRTWLLGPSHPHQNNCNEYVACCA